jgi:inosose dehydratase
MKLAFSRPTAGEAEQRRLFSSFRSAGFDGLQLKAGQYHRYLADPQGFQEAWGRYPAVASALITGGTLDDLGIAALRQTFRFGGSVGTERIVFCHSVPRSSVTDAGLRRFATTLSALGREARDNGTRLSLHHHYDQPVMHRADFDVFFAAADPGAVGLTIDTAHLVKSGVHDIAALIRDFREVIDNIHLKDFAAGEFRVLGEGEIDFDPIFQALREIGYDGWLCADEESGGDLLAGMETCFRFIRARL